MCLTVAGDILDEYLHCFCGLWRCRSGDWGRRTHGDVVLKVLRWLRVCWTEMRSCDGRDKQGASEGEALTRLLRSTRGLEKLIDGTVVDVCSLRSGQRREGG